VITPGAGDYYDRKAREARELRERIAAIETALPTVTDSAIASAVMTMLHNLRRQLERAEYVGD
jgi:hypothetical protein